MAEQKNILIYTDHLLAASETFIKYPAMALTRYSPVFVGSRRVDGLDLPEERTITANGHGTSGRIKQSLRLRLTGHNGVARLARRLRSFSPRLLQAHFGFGAVHAMALAQRLDIPLITYYHGVDATMTDQHAAKARYTRLYLEKRAELIEQTALFLTPSDFIGRKLIERGFPAEKIKTQYIGVAPDPTPPLPLKQRDPFVLFVGRLVEKKGCDYLIEAMAQVQRTYDAELVIVGSGGMRSTLEILAQRKLQRYRFIGWQTPEQVAAWMRRARLFCGPSVTATSGDAEGFGMVFAEAQLRGTPVVSFHHGGIPEAVSHEKTGLLAPERDTDKLAEYIAKLWQDNELWQRFSDAARSRVLKEFNLHTLVAQLEEQYDMLLQD